MAVHPRESGDPVLSSPSQFWNHEDHQEHQGIFVVFVIFVVHFQFDKTWLCELLTRFLSKIRTPHPTSAQQTTVHNTPTTQALGLR